MALNVGEKMIREIKRVIPITESSYPKGVEIPAQGRDDKLGGGMAIFLKLYFATHLVIPALSRDLLCPPK